MRRIRLCRRIRPFAAHFRFRLRNAEKVGGKLFAATADDDWPRECGVYCVDTASGAVVWEHETENSVKNNILLQDGKIIAQDCSGNICCLNAETGEAVYFGKDKLVGTDFTPLKASAALPMFTPPVEFEGRKYFDGGAADSIPVERALQDGCDRLLIVRTRPRDYVKKPESLRHVYTRVLREYPNMIATLDTRHLRYNESLRLCRELEEAGKAVVIAPEYPLSVDKFSTDTEKLEHCYYEGLRDAKHVMADILKLVGK